MAEERAAENCPLAAALAAESRHGEKEEEKGGGRIRVEEDKNYIFRQPASQPAKAAMRTAAGATRPKRKEEENAWLLVVSDNNGGEEAKNCLAGADEEDEAGQKKKGEDKVQIQQWNFRRRGCRRVRRQASSSTQKAGIGAGGIK